MLPFFWSLVFEALSDYDQFVVGEVLSHESNKFRKEKYLDEWNAYKADQEKENPSYDLFLQLDGLIERGFLTGSADVPQHFTPGGGPAKAGIGILECTTGWLDRISRRK